MLLSFLSSQVFLPLTRPNTNTKAFTNTRALYLSMLLCLYLVFSPVSLFFLGIAHVFVFFFAVVFDFVFVLLFVFLLRKCKIRGLSI